jgi:hypothetical protein
VATQGSGSSFNDFNYEDINGRLISVYIVSANLLINLAGDQILHVDAFIEGKGNALR